MRDDDDRLAFETARLVLARLKVEPTTQRAAAIEQVLRLCASTLSVERAGYWAFAADGDELVCERSYQRSTDEVGGGDVLRCGQFPAYWEALAARRVIAAHDAATHPSTADLAPGYLTPLGISSMLDAPVFLGGELSGVVCLEHVGPARVWTAQEVSFAGAVADLLAMLLEQVERVAAQDQLRGRLTRVMGTNQLGALEQLARSVAHDFANIVLAVELCATRLASPARARTLAADVELSKSLAACAEIGASLVGQLRRFGARGAATPRLPITDVLDRLAPILRTLTRESAALEVEVELEREVEVEVPVDRLEQLVLNLVLNARDAISESGTIVLRASATAAEVVLEVWDDGVGMTPDVLAQIWDPYFTTKPRGHGVGLSTVKAIVDDAGGSITVESKPAVGSTFTVHLPRA